jgi:hypothetical protein
MRKDARLVIEHQLVSGPSISGMDQCSSSFAASPAMIRQYFSELAIRNFLPNMIMTKNTEEAAMPTNAAEMKQF